jgi:cytochrome c oxidase accessory protein FixG
VENQDSLELYQKRIPIITRSVKGKFRRFKTAVLLFGFAVFFLLPWIPWHRAHGIPQAVAFDVGQRKFYIFNLIVYPQDVFWLAFLLFIAAVFLFFITTLLGRAFCGYFCFQTLWTDAFMFVERWMQGERPVRMKLQKQAWNGEKLVKVGGTYVIWFLISFWTGMTFVLYYGYAPDLLHRFFIGDAASAAYITVFGLTFSTLIAAGFMREQICAYVCPYGRFQSVMYEPETLAVTYEYRRGEGKNGRIGMKGELKQREKRQEQGHGDCIDCSICVQVCPVGIDIREGLQYRCISCGLCIDGCNEVMKSVGFPQGLIRYDSELNAESAAPKAPHLHWKRLKVLGYFAALVVMTTGLIMDIVNEKDFEYSVEQIRQPLYVTMSNGDIRDRYEIRLTNQADESVRFHISAEGLPPGALNLGLMQDALVHSGHSIIVDVGVELKPDQIKQYKSFEFVIQSLTNDKDRVEVPMNFFSESSGI